MSAPPKGISIPKLNPIFELAHNLERVDAPVKQKSEASAENLSVMTLLGKVVRRCCIPTTILTRLLKDVGILGFVHMPQKQSLERAPNRPPAEPKPTRLHVENKKGRGTDAAASKHAPVKYKI
jgi:hypothetical protein